jgi:hypothetical protein
MGLSTKPKPNTAATKTATKTAAKKPTPRVRTLANDLAALQTGVISPDNLPTAAGMMPEATATQSGGLNITKPAVDTNEWVKNRTSFAEDVPKRDWKRDIADVAPYLSNFANAFRRAPQPATPKSFNPVKFSKVNFDADKAEVDRSVAGMNQGVRFMPENQAAAVRTANLTQGIRAKNQINQAEANANAQITNTGNMANSQIDMQNVNNQNQYADAQVNRQMVNTSMQSANLANAADKFVASSNQRDLMKLEGTKYGILSKVYANSGVLDRMTADMGIDPRTNTPIMKKRAGGMYKVFGKGGTIDPRPGLTRGLIPTPQYRMSSARTPTASDSILYKQNFEKMLRNDPEAVKNNEVLTRTPWVGGLKDPDLFAYGLNQINAYDDALNPRGLMTDAQVNAELSRPLVLPKDVKKKAFGGLLEEPRPGVVGAPTNVYSRATNRHTSMGGHAYAQTMEADRTGDAMIQSAQGTSYGNAQLNIAPRAAQTSEAARSGDYFVPPAANHQYVTLKNMQRPVADQTLDKYIANTKKFKMGGKLRKLY